MPSGTSLVFKKLLLLTVSLQSPEDPVTAAPAGRAIGQQATMVRRYARFRLTRSASWTTVSRPAAKRLAQLVDVQFRQIALP